MWLGSRDNPAFRRFANAPGCMTPFVNNWPARPVDVWERMEDWRVAADSSQQRLSPRTRGEGREVPR